MKKIDLSTWDRREYYEFFNFSDIPQYSLTFNIDVTNFYKFVKANNISFFCAMVYAVTKTMMEEEAFCYRIHEDGVYMCDEIFPSFTFLNKGEKLFKMVTLPLKGDIVEYAKYAQQTATEQKHRLPKTYDEETDNCVYITSLPWITYTDCQLECVINKDDSIPRVCIGKYFTDFNGKKMMPFTLKVNHRVTNGYDIGLYYERLQKYLDSL